MVIGSRSRVPCGRWDPGLGRDLCPRLGWHGFGAAQHGHRTGTSWAAIKMGLAIAAVSGGVLG